MKINPHLGPLIIGACIGILVLLTVGSIAWFWRYQSSAQQQSTILDTTAEPSATPTPTPTPDPLRPRTALLLGYMGGSHDGGALTDTIMVVQVDPKSKQVSLISLPRDLWVDLPLDPQSTVSGKINTAFALGNDQRQYPSRDARYQGDQGGLNLSSDVVSQITGLPIEATVAINMQGFLNALNSLGSLTINVPYSFVDEFYPIAGLENESCGFTPEDIATISATLRGFELEKQFPCRYETLEFTAGPTVMDAETTLKFVRSRHSGTGGGDFGRTQRQQALITAIKEHLSSPSNWLSIVPTATRLYKTVATNLEMTQFIDLIQLVASPADYQIRSLTIDTSNALQEGWSADRQYILVPRQFVTPTPILTSTNSGDLLPSVTPTIDQIAEGSLNATNPWLPVQTLISDFLLN